MADHQNKLCYVVMGFGRKTDFETGRTLDLDKSYKNMIKPAVEAAGLKCLRADEIIHSGLIDTPMYEYLFNADVVIADLSTLNKNALYELGVRHALRPYSTIIIAEDGVRSFPFDVFPVAVRQYHHLGEDVSFDEAMRFREVLRETIQAALANADKDEPTPDSPIYTFLQNLKPPRLSEVATPAELLPIKKNAAGLPGKPDVPAQANAKSENKSLANLIEQGEEAIKDGRFSNAVTFFQSALKLDQNNSNLTQRLVFSIYNANQPDHVTALKNARKLLDSLSPKTSNDPQTLNLLGDIEHALFETHQSVNYLADARRAYERLYNITHDWNNGIILAYLVFQHASYRKLQREKDADIVIAERLCSEVIDIGKKRLAEIDALHKVESYLPNAPSAIEREQEQCRIFCAIAEAYYYLGDNENYLDARNEVTLIQGEAEILKDLDTKLRHLDTLFENKSSSFLTNGETHPSGSAQILSALDKPNRVEAEKSNVPVEEVTERNLIFFSYSHEDAYWLNEIKTTLAPAFRRQKISLWDDEAIKPGEKWEEKIEEALSKSRAAVLLVSRNFLASEFIADEELSYILTNAETQGIIPLWICIEECLYEEAGLRKYQCLNNPKTPLTNLSIDDQRREIVSICKKIIGRAFSE